MSGETTQVLLAVEAEAYVEALEQFDVKDIGSPSWSRQHEYLEKLNMQAVISASSHEDEFVKEALITFEKIPVLIRDLLVTEIWKQKIFTELMNSGFEPRTTFPLYMALYHEATVINLLETVLFHRETCESADDTILDLVDYCYRKLTHLVARMSDEDEDDEFEVGTSSVTSSTSATSMEELEKQGRNLDFDICIKAVTLIRYITDHLEGLPLSVMTRILNTHDVPNLLVQLVEMPPWLRRKNGKVYKYIDSKWVEVSHEDSFKLTKIEGQVWIALYHLLMGGDCQKKYDIDSYRKNTILKLRSHLTEILLDQLPVLAEMQRYLEQLSMMEPPAPQKSFVLEQVPEIREGILKQWEGKWKQLAKKQSKTHFNPSAEAIRAQAQRWAETYNMDVLEGLLTEPPKCAACGQPATKRCSRCHNEWYCRRECQVNQWKKHKPACDLLFNSLQKMEADVKATS
ncbi:LOW QUALITY PROTEIN: zinc finger MYND domain-containing protein 10-like [Haliotis rubra]|uniref:LOW QUALITY PROTEIN: zinc finger MYND domain-containing protein 10-like n=1 Tax=Haliotis rubra TaxID=36100 RepID=UPI001EE5ECB6|nr:LOW QUALITY PROTEIN: zinc finger MYND domain-containing protein 10-like [Haliotis rubra]